MHEAITVWNATITEHVHKLMSCLGSQSVEIPKGTGIFQVSLWISLNVDEQNKFWRFQKL